MGARTKSERGKHPAEVRQRILREFSERAARSGIRSVVMAELASELHMSATTLYNHFPSKDELVRALVERWAEDLGASEVAESVSSRSAIDGLVRWAEDWATSVSRFAPAFWDDLRRDHPEAWTIFRKEIRRRKNAGAALLRPHLRPEIHAEMALAVLDRILTLASDTELCERLGISRAEAIRTAIGIWALGALRNRGDLAAISGETKRRMRARGRSAVDPAD